jgi:hypothetical protein
MDLFHENIDTFFWLYISKWQLKVSIIEKSKNSTVQMWGTKLLSPTFKLKDTRKLPQE